MITENLRTIINEIISIVEKQHINDPAIWNHLEIVIQLLGQDEGATIKYLENCSKEEVLFVSQVFEEIAGKLQSWDYIECLKSLSKKFPDENLDIIVKEAADYIL